LEMLSLDTLYAAYEGASEWLSKSQSPDLLSRVNSAARKVLLKLHSELLGENAANEAASPEGAQALLNKACDLQLEVWKFEGTLIREALAKASGSLTRAAGLLSMSYQALAYILESRHKDLLTERSPIRRRSRKGSAPEESPNS
jgi:hypothetical protein